MALFYGWGSTVSKLQIYYYTGTTYFLPPSSQGGSGTNRPQKDEGQNQPWSHPIVLNLRPLDLESSALTTRNNYFYKAIFSDKRRFKHVTSWIRFLGC